MHLDNQEVADHCTVSKKEICKMSKQVDDDTQLSDSDSQYAEGFDDDDEMLKSQVIPAFLSKTYAIMHNEEYKDIVCWGDNGESILILKVDDFSKKVLPHYFKHGNFSSFVRQLNMYGFHKTRQDPNWREFKHPLFKKGHIELLPLIKRKNGSSKVKPEKRERSSDLNDHVLSMNVKKSKLDRDMILRDLTLLKKQTEEMESKYNNVLQENRLLWQTIMKSKKQQDGMKLQMERICRFLYKMYPNRIQPGDDMNYSMLQDKNRTFDIDGNDLSAFREDGFLTPDQYNSSLDFLQMNNVPRADSPRNGPARSSLDFNKPINRLITNGNPKSTNGLNTRTSIMFPSISPSISPNFHPSEGNGVTDFDDFHSIDLSSSSYTQPSIPQSLQPISSTTGNQETPSSPMPPLSLGEPFLKENETEVNSLPPISTEPPVFSTSPSSLPNGGTSLYTSSSTALPGDMNSLYPATSTTLPPDADSIYPAPSLPMSINSTEVVENDPDDPKISYPFNDPSIEIDDNNIVNSLHMGVQKMNEKSDNLQRRVSKMETELSSPFMVPNIEIMEKNEYYLEYYIV